MGEISKAPSEGMQLIAALPAAPLAAIGAYKMGVALGDRVNEDTFSLGTAPQSRFVGM